MARYRNVSGLFLLDGRWAAPGREGRTEMFTVSIQTGSRYLLAIASGLASAADNCAGVVFVAESLRRTSTKRLLFDITALSPEMGPQGAMEVISTLYLHMPPLEKIALLVPRGESLGMVKEAAAHRNIPFREFVDAVEADEWLRA